MKSTIRVDFDFDTNEPFIQLNLVDSNEHLELADKHLRRFVDLQSSVGLKLIYPPRNTDNRTPQIRVEHYGDFERKLVREFHQICKESLGDEQMDAARKVLGALYKTRKNLQDEIEELKVVYSPSPDK